MPSMCWSGSFYLNSLQNSYGGFWRRYSLDLSFKILVLGVHLAVFLISSFWGLSDF